MKYLVMECATSFAVVLDQEGRFYTVPNLGYAVGDVLDEVYLCDAADHLSVVDDAPAHKRPGRLVRWFAAAACLIAVAVGGFAFWQTPIGAVRMRINPEVRMDVNRFDRVVGIEGENDDGVELIEGYQAYGKDIETVANDLADRSREQRYLDPGDMIVIDVDSDDETWTSEVEGRIVGELEKYMGGEVIVITAQDAARAAEAQEAREESERAVPAEQDVPAGDAAGSGGQPAAVSTSTADVVPVPEAPADPGVPALEDDDDGDGDDFEDDDDDDSDDGDDYDDDADDDD